MRSLSDLAAAVPRAVTLETLLASADGDSDAPAAAAAGAAAGSRRPSVSGDVDGLLERLRL
jgi:hypothetical protein